MFSLTPSCNTENPQVLNHRLSQMLPKEQSNFIKNLLGSDLQVKDGIVNLCKEIFEKLKTEERSRFVENCQSMELQGGKFYAACHLYAENDKTRFIGAVLSLHKILKDPILGLEALVREKIDFSNNLSETGIKVNYGAKELSWEIFDKLSAKERVQFVENCKTIKLNGSEFCAIYDIYAQNDKDKFIAAILSLDEPMILKLKELQDLAKEKANFIDRLSMDGIEVNHGAMGLSSKIFDQLTPEARSNFLKNCMAMQLQGTTFFVAYSVCAKKNKQKFIEDVLSTDQTMQNRMRGWEDNRYFFHPELDLKVLAEHPEIGNNLKSPSSSTTQPNFSAREKSPSGIAETNIWNIFSSVMTRITDLISFG